MTAVILLALAQAAGWRTALPAPSVGDTIWVERMVAVPQGWVVRPGPWEAEDDALEALGPVVTMVAEGGVLVRYPLVAWEAGTHTLTAPTAWRIGPSGEADSVPGGRVTVVVASLLPPDSAAPRPPRDPLEREPQAALPVVIGVVAGAGVIVALWRWRRRATRPPLDAEMEAPHRLEPTGDGRVDAARLAARLRRAVAVAEPAAHQALTTDECLAVLASERPEWPLAELRETLHRLDHARFAPPSGSGLATLAEEVDAMERAL